MDCSLLQEDLCAYIDNELDEVARARLEAHLGECEGCAEEVSAFRVVKGVVARIKLHDEPSPESLHVIPTSEQYSPRRQHVSWLRRPIPGYAVALAAAAVLLVLLTSWRHYETGFIQRTQQREAVWAHLRAVSSAFLQDPAAITSVSTRPGPALHERQPVALREGAATVGSCAALHSVYLVGHEPISRLRFRPGDFSTANLDRCAVGGCTYRTGRVGDYSIVSYEDRGAQIVLVSATSPEALLILAQNIPPEMSFDPPDVGY